MRIKRKTSGVTTFHCLTLIAVLLFAAAGLFSCGDPDDSSPEVEYDLDEIRARGVLRAITTFSSTSYFIYRGHTLGYEYELLQRLAAHLGVDLEIVVADDQDLLIDMLRRGDGDIVAHNLAVTTDHLDRVAFTTPHMLTHQVLVQRKPEQWRRMRQQEIDQQVVRNPADLIGKTVHVRRGSSYYERLHNLSDEIGGGIIIEVAHGSVSTESLIRMVAEGVIDYTVADENLAYLYQADYPILDIETTISLPQRIAWAVRKSSSDLLSEVNDWLKTMKQSPDYYAIYNKYFRNRKAFQRHSRSEFFASGRSRISPYDSLIQFHAARIGWDWRLLAALVYQESQFDPEAQSYAGACGLVQILPSTAERFGVYGTDIFDPARNIEAGSSYLGQLRDMFSDVPDTLEQVKFALAAYNVGIAHVKDAQRLAGKYGEDPFMWTGNVEEYMLLKSDPKYYRDSIVVYGYSRGSEPVAFVREIFERYEHYRRLVGGLPQGGAASLTDAPPR